MNKKENLKQTMNEFIIPFCTAGFISSVLLMMCASMTITPLMITWSTFCGIGMVSSLVYNWMV